MGSWCFDIQITIPSFEVNILAYFLEISTFFSREERISAAGVTHSHRISNFDSSLVLLIICMSFVIGFLLLNLKRIISQNRKIISKKLQTLRQMSCQSILPYHSITSSSYQQNIYSSITAISSILKKEITNKDRLYMFVCQPAAAWRKTLCELLLILFQCVREFAGHDPWRTPHVPILEFRGCLPFQL